MLPAFSTERAREAHIYIIHTRQRKQGMNGMNYRQRALSSVCTTAVRRAEARRGAGLDKTIGAWAGIFIERREEEHEL